MNEDYIKLADIKKQRKEQETAVEKLRVRISEVKKDHQKLMTQIETLNNENSVEPEVIEKNVKEGAALQLKANAFKESTERLQDALNKAENLAGDLQHKFREESKKVSLSESHKIIKTIPL